MILVNFQRTVIYYPIYKNKNSFFTIYLAELQRIITPAECRLNFCDIFPPVSKHLNELALEYLYQLRQH